MATKYWISTSSTSFNTAGNWSDSAAPANSDTLIFNSLGTANCSTNLNSAITGATLIKEKSYTGQIGVLTGATATYLTLSGGTVYLENNTGAGSPSGSPLIMIDTGSAADGNVYVYDSSSSSASTYYAPILLKGGGGGQFLNVFMYGGNVGIAALVGETATTKVYITKGAGAQISPSLYIGHGATVSDFTASTGAIYNQSDNAVTAMRIEGDAAFTQLGTGALTLASVYGNSTLYHRGTGAITTLNITGGTLDRQQATSAITIGGTAFNIGKNAKLLLNNGKASSITRSNKALAAGVLLQDITIQLPAGELF